jgi:ATP-dependent helicase/nuclease subunit B
MPTQLLLAPVGAGKTSRALAALVNALQKDQFARIWVLLPSRRQEDAFRQRLIDYDPTRRIYFNVQFFNFYALYSHLLDIASYPQRQLDNTARLRLLREILVDLQADGELEVYGQIAAKPGFVEIVADFIYELKQNVILPDTFGLAARTPKDRDLAKIYAAYQDKLRLHDLVDREGEGWLARDIVVGNPEIGDGVAFFLVDGFDQFNPLQTQLLALLARRAVNAMITLPTVPLRENTVGRRFNEAYTRLRAAFQAVKEPLLEERMGQASEFCQPALRFLNEKSFLPLASDERRPSENTLALIEAPDPAQEAGAVLRRVKRMLLEGNGQPDDILIAVRDWERYASHFAALGRTYKIPLSLHYGEPLASNPALVALLNLLALPDSGFRRRDLLDVLRSPYFAVAGLDSTWVDLLERVSLSQLVIGGRGEWLEAIERATVLSPDDDEIEKFVLDQAQAHHLAYHLNRFFDAVTPPKQAAVGDYVAWLEDLIGADITDPDEESEAIDEPVYSLHLFPQLRSPTVAESIVSRDLSAMHAFKRILRSLLTAQNLFIALRMGDKTWHDWPSFFTDLKTSLGAAAINRDANRAGKVLVTTITDSRGLPHRHIFIPGLSEGVFPKPTPEDPLYLDSERLALTKRGVYLETSAERSADEGLFYELISQAHDSLTLSRPTVQNGVLWPESHLWRAVRDVFSDAPDIIIRDRLALGAVVPPNDVASADEAVLAAASGLNDTEDKTAMTPLYNWLVTVDDWRWADVQLQWKHILRGRQIELGRITGGRTGDRYSGRISHAGLIEWVAQELGEKHIWSASQLNEYGTCGFRFFSKRLLKLDALQEPEDGMDARQRGSVIHAILELTYQAIADSGFAIAPEYSDTALEWLQRSAEQVLQNAPAQYGFRASALWEQEKAALLRKLEKLVALDFSEKSPVIAHFGETERRPYKIESGFSQQGTIHLRISPELEPLLVTGKIDRIDRQGNRVIVVDYKSGSSEIDTSEMRRGRNYQMMLYLRAVEQILENDPNADRPTEIGGGLFWHLPRNKASGVFFLENEMDREAMQVAETRLAEQIIAGREGNFTAEPNKAEENRCYKHCEFSQLCRISIANRGR